MDSGQQSKELERVRLRAGRLLEKGHSQAEVARRVGVSRAAVCIWSRKLEAGGLDALRSQRPRGRPPSLDKADRGQLEKMLLQGPMSQGFATDVWTVPRVRALLIREFGVELSESQVWRVLRAMGFSPQRPSRRARQQDEAAVYEWKKKRWPALKKTPENRGA